MNRSTCVSTDRAVMCCHKQVSEKRLSKKCRIVNFTVLHFLLSCFLMIHTNVKAQKITFAGKDISLEKIFLAIEKQTGYAVFYNYSIIKNTKAVTVNAKSTPLEEFLKMCLTGLPLKYAIEGKTIMIAKKNSGNDEAISNNTNNKDDNSSLIDVRGKVINEKGEPVAGVTVTVKGTDRAIATDDKGEFLLKKVGVGVTLVLSGVNIERNEVRVNGSDYLSITVKIRVALGEEVVVSTGYQKISKERFVGSVSNVDSALFNREVSTNLLSRLDGITNSLLFSNLPGGHLQIRGLSSINSGIEPLFILDDFPYYGDINNINPNDVQDITILKDAAAASIWGAQAGNGVIVIKTKKGRYNQPFRLLLKSNVTVQEKPDLFYYPQMSTSDFIDVEEFLFSKGNYDQYFTSTYPSLVSPVVEILKKQRDGAISEQDADVQINALRKLDVRNDYNKYVLRRGVNQQHYLNLSGGSNTVNYTFSIGYDHNLPQRKGPAGDDRYTINTSNVFKPFKLLEVSVGVSFTQTVSKDGGLNVPSNSFYPYTQLADSLGNHLAVVKDYRLSFVDTVGRGRLLDWHYRPLDEANLVDNSIKTQFFNLNLGTTIHITPWLSGEVKYQYSQQTELDRNYYSKETYFARNLINEFYNDTAHTEALRHPIPIGGILDLKNAQLVSHNFRGQLSVNKDWQGKHNLVALVAGEMRESRQAFNKTRFYGYNDDILTYSNSINNDVAYPLYYLGGNSKISGGNGIGESLNTFVSFLGNISYTYNSRYTFYASGRKDASNVFGVNTNNRWKPLWSTGIGWDISKERYYTVRWLPYLKLRTSYGYTGTPPIVPGVTTIGYASQLSTITGAPHAYINNPPNPDLRWEQVGILNVGLDFKAVKNRISGSVEWYLKKSKDLIAGVRLEPTLGVIGSVDRNTASLRGQGIDIVLNTFNTTGEFQWNSSFNFSYAKTIVTKYLQNQVKGPIVDNIINPIEGKLAWGLYSYAWAGLDPLTGDPQGYLNGVLSKDYSGIIHDTVQHQVFNGSLLPLYFGNLLNNFSYKGFNLSANITYKLAYYFRRPTISYVNLFNDGRGHIDYTKRWQKPGDEDFTIVPSMIYPANPSRDVLYTKSAVNVEKADNVRLNDVRLNYNWVNKRLKRLPLRSAQFYLYVSNLNILLWRANQSDLDPSALGEVPPARNWAAGITMSF